MPKTNKLINKKTLYCITHSLKYKENTSALQMSKQRIAHIVWKRNSGGTGRGLVCPDGFVHGTLLAYRGETTNQSTLSVSWTLIWSATAASVFSLLQHQSSVSYSIQHPTLFSSLLHMDTWHLYLYCMLFFLSVYLKVSLILFKCLRVQGEFIKL